MTILVSSLIFTKDCASSSTKGILTGAITGLGIGGIGVVGKNFSNENVAAAAGSSAAAGAIMGSLSGGVGEATISGLLSSTISGASISYISGNAASVIPPFLRTIILGTSDTSETNSKQHYTFDCWKAVLHEDSNEPSFGKSLYSVAEDKRIRNVFINSKDHNLLPEIVLENIWFEKFFIQFITINSNDLSAHAIRI